METFIVETTQHSWAVWLVMIVVTLSLIGCGVAAAYHRSQWSRIVLLASLVSIPSAFVFSLIIPIDTPGNINEALPQGYTYHQEGFVTTDAGGNCMLDGGMVMAFPRQVYQYEINCTSM